MVKKHNGIVPSKGGERTTPLEAPQHRLYYCASTFTSFPACRVKLMPLKTSLVVYRINFVGLLDPLLLQEIRDLNTTNLSKLLGQTINASSTRKCWVWTGESGNRKSLYNFSSLSLYSFISQGLLHLTLTFT